jgi:hypothetical protein
MTNTEKINNHLLYIRLSLALNEPFRQFRIDHRGYLEGIEAHLNGISILLNGKNNQVAHNKNNRIAKFGANSEPVKRSG